ncbi:MAG: arsenate reductase, glutathione/glutaredoxin type [Cyanobacteria bacterium SBLK]|nr:arsenate reductase, glutathione/glutaredoxin type [Cyanobacteria bacterium SBLK]
MKRVMFICKKNSSRSQMAEGFAKQLGMGKIEAVSSGLEASVVNPHAIKAMADVGIDINNQTSDALNKFKPEDFDAVISLCGCGINLPSEWVTREIFEDWELDDPAKQPEIFPRVREEVKERVAKLITKILEG